MQTYLQLKQEAEALRNSKDFSLAASVYQKAIDEYPGEVDRWVAWGRVYSLQKLKRYEEGLTECRIWFARFPDFENLKSVYAWCIYSTQIKIGTIDNEAMFLKAARGILQLSKLEDKFSPCTKTILQVIKYFNDKPSPSSDQILNWSQLLDPSLLDKNSFEFIDKEGKSRAVASDYEQYCAARSKALFDSGNYQESLDLCQVALKTCTSFHYSNDAWFARRMALSYSALGQDLVALDRLQQLVLIKKEWFIYKEIAEIQLRLDRVNDSLRQAATGALLPGDVDKRVNLYMLIADLLIRQDRLKEAQPHLYLVYRVRKESQWKIDSELTAKLELHKVDLTTDVEFKPLMSQLRQIWQDLQLSGKEQFRGEITSILPNGKAGFIRTQKNKSVYFQMSEFRSRPNTCVPGCKVEFYLEDGFDKKKSMPTQVAVHINISGVIRQ